MSVIAFESVSELAKFISNALRKRKENRDAYMQFVRMLREGDEAQQQLCYKALTECVTDVDVNRCSELFQVVLEFNWLGDQPTIETFANFLVNLVSANRDAVKSVLLMLLEQLKAKLIDVQDETGENDDIVSTLCQTPAMRAETGASTDAWKISQISQNRSDTKIVNHSRACLSVPCCRSVARREACRRGRLAAAQQSSAAGAV